MFIISSVIFYILIFSAVYVQVFFLVTFLENRKKIVVRDGSVSLERYPAVTIVVPCWNEEKTVYKTIRSIFALNYPREKIKILLVDDGSTDKTWDVLKDFARYKNVKIFRKKNEGKHTALNLAINNTQTDFLACLDADSFVHPEALVRIMSYFEKDPDVMAVTPSLVVNNPKRLVQNAQKVEYHISVFAKRMLAFLGAIHVTPGPFTVFKTEVFKKIGLYHYAHNTEDMEIAYRMQKNHLKIDYCNDAYVYTNTPSTVKKLYKQRLRWIYGFINNTIDYKDVLLKKKYGNFSTFTVPAGVISLFTVSFLIGKLAYNVFDFLALKITQYQTVGFDVYFNAKNFDLFFFDADPFVFIGIVIYSLVIFSIILGRKMIEGKWGLSFSTLSFFLVFSVVAPFWLMKAIFNTLISQTPSWR